jgi:hypothetical protein
MLTEIRKTRFIRAEPGSVRRMVLLCDDDKLSRAVQVSLQNYGRVIRLEADSQANERPADAALIVIALSSPVTEPVVLLAKAALGDRIGHTPILIISDRPFEPMPGKLISHLEFPFSSQALAHKVAEILEPRPRALSTAELSTIISLREPVYASAVSE